MRKHILISANPLRPEPAIRNDGGVVRDLVSVRFVANVGLDLLNRRPTPNSPGIAGFAPS